jgi:hypothetical protein
MDNLFKRQILALLLTFSGTSFAFDSVNFHINTPEGHMESPKIFGADVMLIKKDNPTSGTIFVKFNSHPESILDYKKFLSEKIYESKTISPVDISEIKETKIEGKISYALNFLSADRKEKYFFFILPKDQKNYLFIMQKGFQNNFDYLNKPLMNVLGTIRFK